jgi:hypothetical protein
MRGIRSLIVAGFAFATFGFSFVIAASPRPGADSDSGGTTAAHGDRRGAGLVVAQRVQSPVRATNGLTVGTATNPAALARLDALKTILHAQGVTNLSALGTLTISGRVVPQPGFVRAGFVKNWASLPTGTTARSAPNQNAPGRLPSGSTPQPAPSVQAPAETAILEPSNMTTAPTTVHNARSLKLSAAESAVAGRGDGTVSVPAVKITGDPLVQSGQSGGRSGAVTAFGTLPLYTAYWVANSINLPDNTTIVIQPNVRFLVIIANSITVGLNVTITYEDVPVMNPPAVPGKPSTVPGKPGTPNPFTDGTAGSQGYSGTQPPQIGTPPDAPQVEVWTLGLSQMPTVILKGQHGYQGVQGGAGGNGGPGGNGSDSDHNLINCKDGPADGGAGGKGGRGGDGGKGGNGGTGGIWSLYAQTLPSSMTVDVSGGERGVGGDPGLGGSGGPGGGRGAITGVCANQNWSGRHDGAAGPSGDPGIKGPDGVAGAILPNSINQVVISAADFSNALLEPAIQHVYPEYPNTTIVGSTITIDGLNFTNTDTVTVNGVSAATQYYANTMLTATVPNTWGGVAQVKVVRVSTATSNTGTLYIKPVILSTVPPSPSSRLRPGSTVAVHGTGFSQQTSVRVNHQDIATVTASTPQTLSFVMVRPTSIPHDPAHAAGEPAILSVAGSGPIIESDPIPIVIATYQMLVIGDSVIWGEGLQDPNKIHSLVEAYEETLHPGMSVYKTVKAHTGAILSWNTSISGIEHNGDIPQDYPSIQQQANALASLPNAATIDLILVTSCANDVGFKHFLDPLATYPNIAARVSQYCHNDMKSFLTSLAGQFPAATIVVAGYYQGLSLDSDPNYFVTVTGVLYGLEDNQGLGPDALAAAVGISPANKPLVSAHAAYFASQANIRLAAAVNDANVSLTPHRIFFADPGFGPTNAANASQAWLFGLAGIPIPHSTDSSAALSERENQCAAVYNTSSFDYMFCRLAAAGHPNETGATKYFDAIKPFL